MRFTILLALICTLEAVPLLDKKWEQFKVDFDRTYATPGEEAYRKAIFASTLQYHQSHNELFRQGVHTHSVDVNQFSDWTAAEYESYLSPMEVNMTSYNAMLSTMEPKPFDALPDSFDWRTQGGVSPVKNQGQCGSCWAFATVAVIEAAELIQKQTTISLSEQQLVDCDKKDAGCNGGNCDTALAYVVANGLETDALYPYKAKNQACANVATQAHLKIAAAHSLQHPTPETTLMTSIQTNGPTAVYIDASGSDFQNYKTGIISTGTKKLNHAVTAVGWTSNSWIIKNSWGTSWGQAGYFQLARGNDVRGVSEYGFYATL